MRTDLSAAYVDRLAELVHLTRRGYGGEPWNLPGIKAAISKTQDTGAEPLDICCVALSAAADQSMQTPVLMAESGRHWTHATTGTPAHRECRHGRRIATNADKDETDSATCDQCDAERIARSNVPDWRATYDQAKAEHLPQRRQALHGRNQT